MSIPQGVITSTVSDEKTLDLYGHMFKSRTIFVRGEIEDEMANDIIVQLLFLNEQDPEKDIKMYINSPGGYCSSGFAIYDTMKSLDCDIETIAMGSVCSMGATIMLAGTKGKRTSLPNTEFMIHQPLGGAHGDATNIEITSKNIQYTKKLLAQIVADNTGQDLKKVVADMDRDNYMNAKEAKKYGLIDKILK